MTKKTNIDINRYFAAILYEEDKNYEKYIKNIKKNFYEVTWIRHDRDINELRRIKKATHTYYV